MYGDQGVFPNLSGGMVERADLATDGVFLFPSFAGSTLFFHVVMDFFSLRLLQQVCQKSTEAKRPSEILWLYAPSEVQGCS